jgi:hypothetical protein
MKRLAFTMNISNVSVLHPSRANEWIKRAAPQIHEFCAFIRLLDWWTSCLWNGQPNSVPFWKYKDHEMLGEEDVILQWRWINMEITAWNVNLIACSNKGAGKSIKLASLLYNWYLLTGYTDIKGCKRTLWSWEMFQKSMKVQKMERFCVSAFAVRKHLADRQHSDWLMQHKEHQNSTKNLGSEKCWLFLGGGVLGSGGAGDSPFHYRTWGIQNTHIVQGFPGWQSSDIGRNTWPDWQQHILPLKKRITHSVHICWS